MIESPYRGPRRPCSRHGLRRPQGSDDRARGRRCPRRERRNSPSTRLADMIGGRRSRSPKPVARAGRRRLGELPAAREGRRPWATPRPTRCSSTRRCGRRTRRTRRTKWMRDRASRPAGRHVEPGSGATTSGTPPRGATHPVLRCRREQAAAAATRVMRRAEAVRRAGHDRELRRDGEAAQRRPGQQGPRRRPRRLPAERWCRSSRAPSRRSSPARSARSCARSSATTSSGATRSPKCASSSRRHVRAAPCADGAEHVHRRRWRRRARSR